MLDQRSTQPSLTTRIASADLPDLVELEVRVRVDEWQGVACVYTSPWLLRQAAKSLQNWSFHPTGQVQLEAGDEKNNCGLLRLRFYSIDLSVHLMCHVQIASMNLKSARPEGVRRLSLEMPTEPGLVERYARQLEAIVETVGEEAELLGVM